MSYGPPAMQGYYDVYGGLHQPHPMYMAQVKQLKFSSNTLLIHNKQGQMAPAGYAPMVPTQPHTMVNYGGNRAPQLQGQGTPTPNAMMPSYYHPQPQQSPHHQSNSPTSNKKPKNLRVEIPNESSASPQPPSMDVHQLPPPPPPPQLAVPIAPPSALPSQFAHNLPSPSTFYPEFYQQSELPSPLNFSSTPTSGGTSFYWPPSRNPSMSGPSVGGGGEYKPSPLAKM
jgi:hypothetical protein